MKYVLTFLSVAIGLMFSAGTGNAATSSLKEPIVLMWQVPWNTTEGDLAYLASQGITHTQSFAHGGRPDEDVLEHLEALKRHGLKAFVYLGKLRQTPNGCRYPARTVDRILKMKDNPTIAAWHTVDEPANHDISKECQRDLYEQVKALDPDRPIMVSTNNNRRFKYSEFFTEDAFDILDIHYYVNPHIARGQQNLINFFKEFRTRDYPVIITFRAFESPHRPNRKKMVPGSFGDQYNFFIADAGVTRNFGFYGWKLSPNVGIKRLPNLQRDFESLMGWWRSVNPVYIPHHQ